MPQEYFRFAMGDRVRDKLSGFNGVVVTQINYYNGCLRYSVLAENLEAGKSVEEWIDEAQLELIETARKPKAIVEKGTGGPGKVPTLKVP